MKAPAVRQTLDARQVQDAKIALVHAQGGILSTHCTGIFGAEQI